ncbi:MAG: AMP-binding enzyme, partial [Janthinobacterium lividum]
GRLRTSDRGGWRDELDGSRRLEVLGRVDDVVVSGGYNVDLATVEARAQAWPARGAADIVVVGVPHPEWGVEVVAVTDAPLLYDDLRAWVRAELPVLAAPRRLVVLDRLPRTASGKVDRRRLQTDLIEEKHAR